MSNHKMIVTRATGMWSVGQIIEPFSGVLRQQLREGGFAKPYEEPSPPVVECAAAAAVDSPSTLLPVVPSATGATTPPKRKQHAR